MKRKISIFLFLILLPIGQIHAADSVAFAVYDGFSQRMLNPDTDTMYMLNYQGGSNPYRLLFNIENDVALGGMSLCYRIWSPNGAQWHYVAQPGGFGRYGPNTGIAAMTVVPGSRLDPPEEAFDMTSLLLHEGNVDGILADSMCLGGQNLLDSLDAGPMEPMIALHFALDSINPMDNKTICFDSCFVPPDPCWIFTHTSGYTFFPAVGPAICFPVKYQNLNFDDSVAISIYDIVNDRILDPATDTIYTIDAATRKPLAYQMRIGIENNAALEGMNISFRIWSPDGAQWQYDAQPDGLGPEGPNTGLAAVTIGPGTRLDPPEEAFDMSFYIHEKNVDGLLDDTISFSGVSLIDSLAEGPMEEMINIHFTPEAFEVGEVKTICFDSAFVPPAVAWVFVNTLGASFPPRIGSAICFPVMTPAPVFTDSVAISIYDEHLDRILDPASDVMYMLDYWADTINYQIQISLENESALGGMSLGFRIWSPDGAAWKYNHIIWDPGPAPYWEAVSVFPGCRLDPPDSAFDMTGLLVTTKDIDGQVADTILFGGVSLFDSLEAGPMEPMIAVNFSLTGIPMGEIKTICFDSTFVPPAGNWVFTNTGGTTYPPAMAPMICFPVGYMDWDDAENGTQPIPYMFDLRQNYPNPFNPTTVIRYSIPRRCRVNISIFNILGQKVKTLVDREINAGHHEEIWDGRDDYGHQVSSGIYFYDMKTEEYVETRKMVLIR